MQQPLWNLEYRFTELYGKPLNFDSIVDIVDGIASMKDSTWVRFSQHIRTLYGGTSGAIRFKEYCAAKYVNEDDFFKCFSYYTSRGG